MSFIKEDWERVHLMDSIYLQEMELLEQEHYRFGEKEKQPAKITLKIKDIEMRLSTILEIKGAYPDSILIEAVKKDGEEKYGSIMYMLRDKDVHKIMLSYDNFPFNSKEEAINKMQELADFAMNYNLEEAK